ncbi:carbonic anhydrase [Cystobasidium minutum MCA 4210]|uniref:carbonic anhydrase n=1 Tax=Cystobasidium minutum MCA 4210 TaxID=1397322 RepID=UPI0034CE0302|eukprot:jgi/Rhomi1/172313/fgenesh1_kg.5_\
MPALSTSSILSRCLRGSLIHRHCSPQPFATSRISTPYNVRACSTGSHASVAPTTSSKQTQVRPASSLASSSSTSEQQQLDKNDQTPTMPDRAWTSSRVGPTPAELLSTNQKWLADADPEMFAATAKGQKPSIFWLGCCDSRVPAELITGAAPGDLFVHRNIANTFSSKDGSALAALAYAVNHLGVTDIIVCGHQSCGGVQAALASAKERQAQTDVTDEGTEAIQNWLSPIRALAVANLRTSSSFAAETDPAKAMRTLVEQNVCAQVSNVSSCPVVKNAWRRGQNLTVHGWVYDISTGKIEDLSVSEGTNVGKNPLEN